jgi:hypothetical protein
MKKEPTKKVVVSKKQAPKKETKAPTKKTGLKTLLGKVLKPSPKKLKEKPSDPNAPTILHPKVLKFKRHKQAMDYMEVKHLSGWKLFENKRGGFYLYKGHLNLVNALNKERQTLDTMKALAIGFGAMLIGFGLTSMGNKPIEKKAPGFVKPVKKKPAKKVIKKSKRLIKNGIS